MAAVGTACGSDPEGPDRTDPQLAKDIYIEVHVTGGFAGVDFTYAVDGSAGLALGLSCERICDFEPGRVFTYLSSAQVLQLSEMLRQAGIQGYAGTDFGTECCDQFHYRIVYRDGDGESTVTGSSGALPEELGLAVARLDLLVQGIAPIIVDFDSRPDHWPSDPLQLRGQSLIGSVLELEVEYGGGCEDHVIDLVAWGGWLESFPVQVNVLLAHESNDDPCDALIQDERRFDLTPLRDEYLASYGAAVGDSTVVILRLSAPGGHDPLLIRYAF